MPSTIYVRAAGHLQKRHLSTCYGWENSTAARQNKDPGDPTQTMS